MLRRNVKSPKVDAFLFEIAEVCKKYQLSLSHEDRHGGFIIEKYNDCNLEWLTGASINFE